MNNKTLTWLDYIIVFIALLISSIIGLYYRYTGGRQKTTQEFFNANRDMGVVTIAIGLMISYLSAISLLGVSSEIYNYGTHYCVIIIGYLFATPIIVYFYLPVFFKLNSTSTFQYLEMRFGNTTKLITSTIFLLQFLLYCGVVIYAPALAIESTTGLSVTMSVIIMTIVCTFYSTIGGIKAVLITDIFQAILMIISVIIVIVNAAIDVGGINEIFNIAQQGGRINFNNFSIDPTIRHSWWSVTIGGFFTYLSLYGVNQVQVQRMLTIRKLKNAQKAVWLSLPITIIIVIGISFSGLSIYSKYHNCDPVKNGLLTSDDQLMPYYIMENLSKYPGIPGLFIAGIFSAGLSTISAIQNSVAAIILEDYIKPLYKSRNMEFDENKKTIFSKLLALLTGIICLGLSFIAGYFVNILQAALTIFGIAGGPLLGIYTLGIFFETTNQIGAISGLLASLIFSSWIGFGQPKPKLIKLNDDTSRCYLLNLTIINNLDNNNSSNHDDGNYFYLYRISYMWYCFIGFICCVIVGLITSKIKNLTDKSIQNSNNINPDLFTPFIAKKIRKRQSKI